MSFPMQKDIEEPLLREIAQRGGEARPNELFEAVARHFPQLTEADLKIPHGAVYSPWSTRVHNVRAVLVHKGELNKSAPRGVWRITDKGRQRIGLPPSAQTQVPPETPPHHEVLKQKLVEIGKALGYHTSTEEVLGPVGHRHDVLWRPGPYKKDPSHVIEVCEGETRLRRVTNCPSVIASEAKQSRSPLTSRLLRHFVPRNDRRQATLAMTNE